VLNRGIRLIVTIKQQNKHVLSVELQTLLLFAAMNGYFDNIPEKKLDLFKVYLLNFLLESNILENFSVTESLDQEFLINVFTNLKDLNFVSFDSVMLSEDDLLLQNYGFRLLEVNNRLKMMYLVNTCFLVTSTDVLHS